MLMLSNLIVMTIVLTQEVKSVKEDFNLNFDNETCRGKTKWHLINNNNINLSITDTDNNHVIPMNTSCVSLFGKDLLPDNALEINAYLLLICSNNGINVTVFDESRVPIKSYEYNTSSEMSSSEWYTIKILVNKTIIGYYHFNESGQTIEILKGNINKELFRKTEGIQDVSESDEMIKSEYLLPYNLKRRENNFLSGEGSGDNIGDGDTGLSPPGNVTGEPDTTPSSTFWQPWTIVLIAVGSFTLISIICVSAYHIGRRSTQEENANIIEDVEPPADFRLPRIHRIYSGFSDTFRGNV